MGIQAELSLALMRTTHRLEHLKLLLAMRTAEIMALPASSPLQKPMDFL